MTSYRGALLTRDQAAEASRRHGSSYLFALGDVYLDATESCHARHRPAEVPSLGGAFAETVAELG